MLTILKKQLGETGTVLRSFKGNAKGCLIAEPFWVVPYNLYSAYASVYMLALGCTDVQVGLAASVGLLLQAFFVLSSGYITDKLGRKKTSLIFDLIGWSIPTLIWAFAQNFYFFLAAAIINSTFRIVQTSWSCLMIEDTEPRERVHVFTWLSVAGIIAGFFAPAGGWLVSGLSLVPAVRGLYIFAFVSMTFMFFLRNHITTETRIGLIKMEETRDHRIADTLQEYIRIGRQLVKNSYLIVAFSLMLLNNIQVTLKTTFFSILLTKNLNFPDESISIFPAVSSLAMLVVFLFVMPALGRRDPKKSLVAGFIISILSNLLLVGAPQNSYWIIILSTVLGGAGLAVTSPFIETVVANSVEDGDRAKVYSLLYFVLFGVTAPFGYLGGLLSSVSEKLPFVFIIFIFASCILAVWILRGIEKGKKGD